MRPFEEIGDRVFRRRYDSLDLNVGVIIGDEEVMVIDSRESHRHADLFREELRVLTDLPVRHLVNTHWHWDHVWGNARFAGSAIWGHQRTRTEMIERGEEARAGVLEWISAESHDAVTEVVLTPPDHTIVALADVVVGGRPVWLRYHGRAHTDADLVVHVPDAGVSFMGDLIEEGAPPNFGDAFPLEWPVTLGVILATLHDTVVPGHGDVVDRDFVDAQRGELESVAAVVREVAAGADPTAALIRMPYPDSSGRDAIRRGLGQLTGTAPNF